MVNLKINSVFFYLLVEVMKTTTVCSIHTKTISIYLGTAHCSDMYPPSTLDSSQLIDARETIKQHLKQWLTEDDFV